MGLITLQQGQDLRGIARGGPSSKVMATCFTVGGPAQITTGSAAGAGQAERPDQSRASSMMKLREMAYFLGGISLFHKNKVEGRSRERP